MRLLTAWALAVVAAAALAAERPRVGELPPEAEDEAPPWMEEAPGDESPNPYGDLGDDWDAPRTPGPLLREAPPEDEEPGVAPDDLLRAGLVAPAAPASRG